MRSRWLRRSSSRRSSSRRSTCRVSSGPCGSCRRRSHPERQHSSTRGAYLRCSNVCCSATGRDRLRLHQGRIFVPATLSTLTLAVVGKATVVVNDKGRRRRRPKQPQHNNRHGWPSLSHPLSYYQRRARSCDWISTGAAPDDTVQECSFRLVSGLDRLQDTGEKSKTHIVLCEVQIFFFRDITAAEVPLLCRCCCSLLQQSGAPALPQWSTVVRKHKAPPLAAPARLIHGLTLCSSSGRESEEAESCVCVRYII